MLRSTPICSFEICSACSTAGTPTATFLGRVTRTRVSSMSVARGLRRHTARLSRSRRRGSGRRSQRAISATRPRAAAPRARRCRARPPRSPAAADSRTRECGSSVEHLLGEVDHRLVLRDQAARRRAARPRRRRRRSAHPTARASASPASARDSPWPAHGPVRRAARAAANSVHDTYQGRSSLELRPPASATRRSANSRASGVIPSLSSSASARSSASTR